MKISLHLLLVVVTLVVQRDECESTDVKRFIIVSDYEVAWSFYFGSLRSSKESCEWNVDLSFKKRICDDITGSTLFSKEREYNSVEMKKAPKLTTRLFKSTHKCNYCSTVITVLNRYEKPVEENVFVCLTRTADDKVIENYISDEYNLNSQSQGSGYGYLPGRFIFRENPEIKRIELYGMAQTPANAFVSPDYSTEHLYLQRRRFYSLAWKNSEDALCKLTSGKKKLIYLAALNSKYFEGRIKSPRNIDQIDCECKLKTVSFQTKHARKGRNVNRKFRERMLKCNHRASHERSHYYISQAYQSHETFVYFGNPYTLKVSLENLSTNVRLPVEVNRFYFSGDEEKVLEDKAEQFFEQHPNCIVS